MKIFVWTMNIRIGHQLGEFCDGRNSVSDLLITVIYRAYVRMFRLPSESLSYSLHIAVVYTFLDFYNIRTLALGVVEILFEFERAWPSC